MIEFTESFEFAVADLNDLVPLLAAAKAVVDAEKAEQTKLDAEIESVFGNRRRALQQRVDDAQAEADVLDAQIRIVALEEHAVTGVKQVHPAVMVKGFTTLSYDQDAALEYCREHLPKALKLHVPTFKKAAKVLDLDFVTISTTAKATVRRDLSAWLDGNSPDDKA